LFLLYLSDFPNQGKIFLNFFGQAGKIPCRNKLLGHQIRPDACTSNTGLKPGRQTLFGQLNTAGGGATVVKFQTSPVQVLGAFTSSIRQ
jgi:hypothetical protein